MRQQLLHLLTADERDDGFTRVALRRFWSLRSSRSPAAPAPRALEASVVSLAQWALARARGAGR